MTRFSIDSVKIEDVGDTAVLFRVLNSFQHGLGIQTGGPDTGNPYNEQRYVTSRNEEYTLETTALETILDTISLLTGKCVQDGGTEVGLEMYGQGHDPCGTSGRTAGSTHMKKLCEESHLVVSSIAGSVGQDATASVRVICLSDNGTTKPTTTVFNAALPSSPISDEVFVIAQPQIAGTALAVDSIQSVNLETGLEIRVIQPAGSIFPTKVLVLKSAPTIRLVTEDISTVQALIGEDGVACTLANTFVQYQKRLTNGGLIAAASAEHIKVAVEGFAYISDAYNASGRGVGTLEVMIECTEPASGVPLTVTTNTALS